MEIIKSENEIHIVGNETSDSIEELLDKRSELINQGKSVLLSIKTPVYKYNPEGPNNKALVLSNECVVDIYEDDTIDDIYNILYKCSKEEYDHKSRVILEEKELDNIISAIYAFQSQLNCDSTRLIIDNNTFFSLRGLDISKPLTLDTLAEACFSRSLDKCSSDMINYNLASTQLTDLLFNTIKQYTYPELFPEIVNNYVRPMIYQRENEQLGRFIILLKKLNNIENFEEESLKYSNPEKDLFELSVLMNFAKNGPEFYEYVVKKIKPEHLDIPGIQEDLIRIKQRNITFKEKRPTSSDIKIDPVEKAKRIIDISNAAESELLSEKETFKGEN